MSSLPSLTALRAFEAAARLRSISAAAAELHVTHGAVSRHVRALEDDLGVPLLLREGRGVRPSAAGEQLQRAAQTAFAHLRTGVNAVRRAPLDAPLVLGCSGSVLARWVIPRLPALQAALPQLRLHWAAQEDGVDEAMDGIDAALLIGRAPWPSAWRVQPLAPERIGPVVSPAAAARLGLRTATADDILAQPLLHTTSRPQAWPQWAHAQGLEANTLRLGDAFEHLYFLLEAAVAGLGVAIAPEPLVADDIAKGRLMAPCGFVDAGGVWALCSLGNDDARIDALAAWLGDALPTR